MKVKHLITVEDLDVDIITSVLSLAERIKKNPISYRTYLRDKMLGLIFEKPSSRTRVSFEVGIKSLGGSSLYLAPEDVQIGKREAVRDAARVLSSYLDGIVLRTYSHKTLTSFAKSSSVPIINGLSDYSHPCQALTDLFTVKEAIGNIKKAKVAYVGDGNNVLTSLMLLFAKMGLTLSFACPKGFGPSEKIRNLVTKYAKKTGAKIVGFTDPKKAVKGADVVYTDVWVSMGQEKEAEEKRKKFKGFQVNKALLKLASKDAKVMHCLPAKRGEEITSDVLESRNSVVFEQAANRLHVQKAILIHLMSEYGV